MCGSRTGDAAVFVTLRHADFGRRMTDFAIHIVFVAHWCGILCSLHMWKSTVVEQTASPLWNVESQFCITLSVQFMSICPVLEFWLENHVASSIEILYFVLDICYSRNLMQRN